MFHIHYINQLDYEILSYPTTLEVDSLLREPYPSVAKAGCGLCCLAMLVEGLTGCRISMEEWVKRSLASGANHFGTDMKILGWETAGEFHLKMEMSSSREALRKCLEGGGCAIVNAGRKQGVFSDGGHFLLVVRLEKETAWILDPSYTEEKYSKPYRAEKVTKIGDYILAGLDMVCEECSNRDPSFYLFWSDGK